MYEETRQTIHIGVNFVFAPAVVTDRAFGLSFQQALLKEAIEFDHAQFDDNGLTVVRKAPSNLTMRVIGAESAPVSQLLVVSAGIASLPGMFCQEADAVIRAFERIWPAPSRQILRCDVTIRDLFETSKDHAFRELWESRLRQPPEALAALGRPVLGGGLRFVMPPQPDKPNDATIEVKIESFLQDSRKLFIEIQFVWPMPQNIAQGGLFDASNRIRQANRYMEDQVIAFISGNTHE